MPHLNIILSLVALLAYTFSAIALAINPLNTTSIPRLGKYNPLPNPYHVPHSSISLDFDFDSPPGSKLNARDATEFCYRVRGYFQQLRVQHGDQEIPPGEKSIEHGILDFRYGSDPHFRMMRYSDIIAVAQGFLIKFQHDGFFERMAIVVYIYPDGNQIETGEVDLGLILAASKLSIA
ncbi:MAG: hypothetical protein Q9174_006595 [Haloplaca sp. 1 TL-2023]